MVLRLFFATVALLAAWLIFTDVLCQILGNTMVMNIAIAIPLPLLTGIACKYVRPESTTCQRRWTR